MQTITLPKIDERSDKTLGDLIVYLLVCDVGTIEEDASDEGWNDPVKRNADPAKIHAINDEI